MGCLEIKLTALPRLYLHFRGIASSIRASGSSRLFSLCCGLRSWSSLSAVPQVSSAKTPTRRRRTGRNNTIVQRRERADYDRWQHCVFDFLAMGSPLSGALDVAAEELVAVHREPQAPVVTEVHLGFPVLLAIRWQTKYPRRSPIRRRWQRQGTKSPRPAFPD